jgi:hypothetical protein
LFKNIEFNTLCKIAIFILVLYLSPLLILGEDSHFRIHDGLANKHDTLKVLSDSGQIFGDHNANIPAILNGVPRSSMGSEYDFMLWLMYFFGPFPALVIGKILVHSVAFFGMYQLLVNHFVGREMKALSLGVSLAFAVLPFWDPIGLSAAALPLVLDAFMSIRKGEGRWFSWLVIGLIPFYSSLYYSFMYMIVFMGLVLGYDIVRLKTVNFKFLGAIVLMSMIFLFVEYRNLYMIFFNVDFVSVREEFGLDAVGYSSFFFGFYKIIESTFSSFAFSNSWNQGLQIFFVIPSIIIGIFLMYDRKVRESRLLFAIFLIVFSSFAYNTGRSDLILPLREQFSFVRKLNVYVIFMQQMLWYLAFALSLKLMVKHSRKGRQVVVFLVSLQILYGFFNHPEIQKSRKPSYRELYSVDLFKQIDDYIGRPKADYRVVSIGLHPGISLYNGFYALDGYFSNYPLAHKKEFKKIIAPELKKSEQLRAYFDEWGARCYVYVAELDYGNWLYTKNKNVVVHKLDLNTNALLGLGGEYIFSAVEIKNYEENQLALLKVFESKASAWRIYLYKVEKIAV